MFRTNSKYLLIKVLEDLTSFFGQFVVGFGDWHQVAFSPISGKSMLNFLFLFFIFFIQYKCFQNRRSCQ